MILRGRLVGNKEDGNGAGPLITLQALQQCHGIEVREVAVENYHLGRMCLDRCQRRQPGLNGACTDLMYPQAFYSLIDRAGEANKEYCGIWFHGAAYAK